MDRVPAWIIWTLFGIAVLIVGAVVAAANAQQLQPAGSIDVSQPSLQGSTQCLQNCQPVDLQSSSDATIIVR